MRRITRRISDRHLALLVLTHCSSHSTDISSSCWLAVTWGYLPPCANALCAPCRRAYVRPPILPSYTYYLPPSANALWRYSPPCSNALYLPPYLRLWTIPTYRPWAIGHWHLQSIAPLRQCFIYTCRHAYAPMGRNNALSFSAAWEGEL